jgi:hypothetical protein
MGDLDQHCYLMVLQATITYTPLYWMWFKENKVKNTLFDRERLLYKGVYLSSTANTSIILFRPTTSLSLRWPVIYWWIIWLYMYSHLLFVKRHYNIVLCVWRFDRYQEAPSAIRLANIAILFIQCKQGRKGKIQKWEEQKLLELAATTGDCPRICNMQGAKAANLVSRYKWQNLDSEL